MSAELAEDDKPVLSVSTEDLDPTRGGRQFTVEVRVEGAVTKEDRIREYLKETMEIWDSFSGTHSFILDDVLDILNGGSE
jgi:hypothetical protein